MSRRDVWETTTLAVDAPDAHIAAEGDRWLDARSRPASDGGPPVTASMVPAILGADRWRTPWRLWAETTGLVEAAPAGAPARVGQALETPVMRLWAEEHAPDDVASVRSNGPRLWAHDTVDWMQATPDGWATLTSGEIVPVEVKVTGSTPDRLTGRVRLQTGWQCAVTGPSRAIVICLAGTDLTWWWVDWPDTALGELVERVAAWRAAHLIRGDEPPPTADDRQELTTLAAGGHSDTVAAGEQIAGLVDRADRLRQVRDEAADELRRVEAELTTLIRQRGARAASDGRRTVTVVTQTRRSLDQRALRADHPELVEQYQREAESHQLRWRAARPGEGVDRPPF